jgi:RNA methyltransferase, TrmH family
MAGVAAQSRRTAELHITSPANPRIKQLVALRRRRGRGQSDVTLVEGFAEITLALAAGAQPQALFYCADFTAPVAAMIARAESAGADVIRVSKPVFEKISYREGPDGWLAVVSAVPDRLDRIRLSARPLVLACTGLEKPGNLGAILRTADAAGFDAVIAADPVTDWGNPNVVRASKGTVFSVQVASASTQEALAWISEHGLTVVAATPDARQLVTEADLTGPTVVAVGAEQAGLPDEWLKSAHVVVRIPMFGLADSLNVSTSAAIISYEAVRQRLLAGHMPEAPTGRGESGRGESGRGESGRGDSGRGEPGRVEG